LTRLSYFFLSCYRAIPHFRGKLRIGNFLFSSYCNQNKTFQFTAHDKVKYDIPNTIENLGLELLINGVYGSDIVKFLKKNVKEKDVFFDVGANIGSIGLPVVKSKPCIQYHAFEASPHVFEYLTKTVDLNGFKKINLIKKAVYHTDHMQLPFFQSFHHGKNSLAPTYSNSSVLVDTITLDRYCEVNKIDQIDWMKIDIQGFELYAFQGAEKILQTGRVKNIIFEYEPWAEEDAKLPIGKAKEFLTDCGYQLFHLNGQPWGTLQKYDKTIHAKHFSTLRS
jgi:FkbM family methyltransferase